MLLSILAQMVVRATVWAFIYVIEHTETKGRGIKMYTYPPPSGASATGCVVLAGAMAMSTEPIKSFGRRLRLGRRAQRHECLRGFRS